MLTSFVAALILGIVNYYAALNAANFAPIVGLVSNNANSEEIINLLLPSKKSNITMLKKLIKKLQILINICYLLF
jgi:hypothetical protein